jgi:phospholipid/cholesterol/gamma-HCH transport system ATP-binding protein
MSGKARPPAADSPAALPTAGAARPPSRRPAAPKAAKPVPILSARGIVNRFGKQEIHDHISFDVLPGEILGIAGGSGSGKSVLLRTLTGLHKPNAGEVMLNGKKIETLDPAEKAAQIGVLFQQGALFSSLSVAQNIMLPMREHTDQPLAEREKLAAMKLELAGLSADSGIKFPGQLSGGMVKRAAFARALALDPRIMFLDEPTSDLDPIAAGGIDALVMQLNRSLGITFVIVTHDLTTLFTVCQRVAILVDKKITLDTVDKLLQSKQPWIHEFLHSPRADAALSAMKASHGNG